MLELTNQKELPESAIDERSTAAFLNVSIKTIQGWRQKKTGPRYHRFGNRIQYFPADLRQYLAECAVDPQSND